MWNGLKNILRSYFQNNRLTKLEAEISLRERLRLDPKELSRKEEENVTLTV